MHKKSIILLPIFLILLLLYLIGNNFYNKSLINKKRQSLPEFTFYYPNGIPFNRDEIVNRDLIVIGLDPDCTSCNIQLELFLENIDEFDNQQLLLVSRNSPELTISFINDYKLNEYSNLITLCDKDDEFPRVFGEFSVPSIFIYSEKNNLVKFFVGETNIELILKAIQ